METIRRRGNTRRVKQFTLDGKFIKEWESIKDAARTLGSAESSTNISKVCKGATLTAFGFRWRYADDALSGDISEQDPKKVSDTGKETEVVKKECSMEEKVKLLPQPEQKVEQPPITDSFAVESPGRRDKRSDWMDSLMTNNPARQIEPSQFNLDKYYEDKNRPVYTRQGDPVKIIATRVNLKDKHFALVGLVKKKDGVEEVYAYTYWGYCDPEEKRKTPYDLVYKPEKKTGWINIYPGFVVGSAEGGLVFDSEEEAIKSGRAAGSRAVLKVEWEE